MGKRIGGKLFGGKRFRISGPIGLTALALLAGCGVDGAPERPEADTPLRLEMTGTAEVGITGGSE